MEATKQCTHQVLRTGIQEVKGWQPDCFDEEEVMFRVIFMLVIAVLNFATFAPALAGEFGTREEARAMVKRVQEKFRRDGAEATFRTITGSSKDLSRPRPLSVHLRYERGGRRSWSQGRFGGQELD